VRGLSRTECRGRRVLPGLCLITDRKAGGTELQGTVSVALAAGVRWIQYREKEKTRGDIYRDSLMVRDMTRQYGALFIVNDHADIACAVDADGVHLGQDDLPLREARKIMGDRIIGISTHSLADAVEAAGGGADYIGFGPVFPTVTKDAGAPKGVGMLREIKRLVSIPVVAIGGISAGNLPEVLASGADAVAVASAILGGDISSNVRTFMTVLGGA
jgi:thiamine-phosphate pyrophosphorylase